MADKVFAKGLYAKLPRVGAPSFVVASVSFKVDDFIQFLNEHKNEKGYVNVDLLKAREEGKLNGVLNDFKPKSRNEPAF